MRSLFLLSALPLALAAPQLANLPLPISPIPLPLPLPPSILNILDSAGVPRKDLIPNQYIVKVKTLAQVTSILKLLNLSPLFTYNFNNFYGFAAVIPSVLLQPLLKLPGIESIEQDAIVRASYLDHLDKRAYVTQGPSTWGLHRISHRTPGSSAFTYVYDNTAGNGTCAYVIDTGIFAQHTEFEGRATQLANFAGDGLNSDANGHGTHCAGTIGSKTYGVAKKARIYGIKVLGKDGAGSNSAVIQGINFVANDVKTARASFCTNGAVASMSLGGSRSATVNAAAASAVANGLFIVAAAGNDAVDANNTSPASEPGVFTVAATDSTDRFATAFSNYGSAVDALAPGVSVQSTWLANGVNTLSGTSMATPHVAGLALYLLALEGKRSVTDLTARIKALALKGVAKDIRPNTVNQVVYNGNPTG